MAKQIIMWKNVLLEELIYRLIERDNGDIEGELVEELK